MSSQYQSLFNIRGTAWSSYCADHARYIIIVLLLDPLHSIPHIHYQLRSLSYDNMDRRVDTQSPTTCVGIRKHNTTVAGDQNSQPVIPTSIASIFSSVDW